MDYFRTRTTDLLTDISLSGIGGYSNTITNGGETENHGIEVLVTGKIIRNENLNWNVTASYTRYRNKIVKTGITGVDGKQKDDLGRRRFVGQPINIPLLYFRWYFSNRCRGNSISGYRWYGYPISKCSKTCCRTIRLKDTNGDGVINDNDHVGTRYGSKMVWLNFYNTGV